MTDDRSARGGFVPPYLLRRIARSGDPGTAALCQDTLRADESFRDMRRTEGSRAGLSAHTEIPVVAEPGLAWRVHDAEHGTRLPGRPVRGPGDPVAGDLAVDEAAAGIEQTLRFFAEALARDSYDGRGAPVVLSVHYRERYENAFWDGRQLVFGDGDGKVFDRFTKPVDVLAHEFGHAVIDASARLVYADQPGALNESVADILASCLLQWLAGHRVEQASWLIGEGLFLPGVRARALRDLAAPGTAYDDPVLGRDPQVAHLDDFVVTEEDNGGVHLNSGIPNRAFHLAALALGGRVWERAGLVWYAALTGERVGPRSDFAGFAAATVEAAADLWDAEAAGLVAKAWADVGVTATSGATGVGEEAAPTPVPAPVPATGQVVVTRSGGFAGITTTLRLDLGQVPPEVRSAELGPLLRSVESARGEAAQAPPALPVADGFVYTFSLPGREPWRVAEPQLSDELRQLADLVERFGGRPETA
ncbi:protealysin inhibitor emfourin [Nocardioides campestrisoli]|uniref:protealysin inhibitor emfourin n=1 Tax=Nocardioides campestrisoli TaxID=2736757 RepID=UPI001CD2521A|nr:protealysin inhibitor emfourin [Nocardioides campestrisoli]